MLTGDICIMTLTAIGVATVLGIYPGITQAIRWAGGAYICWIGLRTFFSRLKSLTTTSAGEQTNWYLRTVGITLLNPKAILFFVSFFPLFMDPSEGVLGSFARMGGLFTLLSGSYLLLFAWTGAKISSRLQSSPAAGIWVPRALGALIVFFGGRILWG